ncbi:MAG: nucleotide sugar dehydrogenase [Candidatus Omnitrophota bacterium]|nr:nucleotide sugar dehydrogenase [Candidatus Omnitrophota bacterium]
MNIYKTLKDKIAKKKAVITVMGLGYVGLPIALEFAKKGFTVNGLDSDKSRVDRLNRGSSYISDINAEELSKIRANKRFKATTDKKVLAGSNIVIVCVPTPLGKTHKPDLSFIIKASRTLKDCLCEGQIVIFESTTYPGTTKEVIMPILEKSGLKAGKDFYLAFSPERIDPGNKEYDFTNITKLVGGITERGGNIAKLLYSYVVKKVVHLSSTETAEVTKLLENTFRIVNIGLINEFANLCNKLDIDVWEVINAAKTKPFGFMPFYPGPGIGGHCIPADPMYLSWKARKVGFETKMIDLAAKVNRNAPVHVVQRIVEILKGEEKKIRGSKIFMVGVTYKRDVNDLRESPALDIMEILIKKGASVSYYDPYVPKFDIDGIKKSSVKPTKKILNMQDIVVVVTDHSCVDYRMIALNAGSIFDTRNIFERKGIKSENVVKL